MQRPFEFSSNVRVNKKDSIIEIHSAATLMLWIGSYFYASDSIITIRGIQTLSHWLFLEEKFWLGSKESLLAIQGVEVL